VIKIFKQFDENLTLTKLITLTKRAED